jgi:selT/selW/selH-like putative selenoprotein
MNNDTNSRLAHGGKAIYGARLGILMLEARFPRIPGDMGNAETWPFPVLYRVVTGASPQRVVREKAAGLLPEFIAAARELVALGADGITTNCGFLSLYQKELAAAVSVPVATSSLMQVPMIQITLPRGKRVGVLTVNAATLTPEHLTAIGVDPSVPVVGTDAGREFTRVMIDNELTMDVTAAEADIVDAVPDRTGGVFEVRVDDEVIWSRKERGRFPEIKEIKQLVRDRGAPGRSLGHTDT